MRRFLMRLAAFLSLQGLVGLVVFMLAPPKHASDHYLAAMQDKVARAKAIPGPRLIFLGGSNLAFGIQSPRFVAAGYSQPVNLGLHAALGLSFCLNLAESILRPGDTVVLVPEYEMLANPLIDGHRDTITSLLAHWPEGVDCFPELKASRLKEFLDRDALWKLHLLVSSVHEPTKEETHLNGEWYRRSKFNEYGDMVGHYKEELRLPERLDPREVSPEYVPRAVEKLNAFYRFCQAHDVTIVFGYPPLAAEEYEAAKHEIAEVHAILSAELEMRILYGPDEMVFPRSCFFDSVYHLTKAGAERRSQSLLDRLTSVAILPEAGATKVR